MIGGFCCSSIIYIFLQSEKYWSNRDLIIALNRNLGSHSFSVFLDPDISLNVCRPSIIHFWGESEWQKDMQLGCSSRLLRWICCILCKRHLPRHTHHHQQQKAGGYNQSSLYFVTVNLKKVKKHCFHHLIDRLDSQRKPKLELGQSSHELY